MDAITAVRRKVLAFSVGDAKRVDILRPVWQAGLVRRHHFTLALPSLTKGIRMTTIDHVKLGDDGRIVIPASARRELGLKSGDTLILESDGVSILLRTTEAVLEETQAYFRQFLQPGDSMVDELLAERRAEARRDDLLADGGSTHDRD